MQHSFRNTERILDHAQQLHAMHLEYTRALNESTSHKHRGYKYSAIMKMLITYLHCTVHAE